MNLEEPDNEEDTPTFIEAALLIGIFAVCFYIFVLMSGLKISNGAPAQMRNNTITIPWGN